MCLSGRKNCVSVPGQTKQVDPELFRVFYTFWKETEAEAQDVNLPSEVIDHLDNNECVFKLSSCVKTSHGVGKIAMTQKRLLLLTEGRAGFLEITKFRDIQVSPLKSLNLFSLRSFSINLKISLVSVQDVKIASAPFLLVRIPSLRIQTCSRPEVFEANLKTETELWNLVVKEMWAGRKMADQHKVQQQLKLDPEMVNFDLRLQQSQSEINISPGSADLFPFQSLQINFLVYSPVCDNNTAL